MAISLKTDYEFGTAKEQPAELAKTLKTSLWTVTVEGAVSKPRAFDIDEIMRMAPLEERIYRHRCVEAWSIVVPWIGFPLSALIKRVEPTSKAKFVAFQTLYDPKQMPSARYAAIPLPLWRACAWTKPCIRWHSFVSACMAKCSRIRMGHL